MSKRRYEGEQTKKHIVDKALILFSQKGYAATSIEDIVAATGFSKGNLYYHFKSKEDLFLYIAEQTLTETWEQWEKISVQYESTTEKLYAFGEYIVDNSQRPLNRAGEEFLNREGTDSKAGQKLFALINNSFERYEKLVSEGIASGEFKNENPRELAFIIFCLHAGLNHRWPNMDKDTMKTLFRKATTYLLHGISTRNET